MYLTGGTVTLIIHMKISFVKLMLIFYANIYEIKEKNSLRQGLLQLVNAAYLYLYPRHGYKNTSRSHKEALYEEYLPFPIRWY